MDRTPGTPRDHEATVRRLREAAAARVENTSLRGVAREVGMSPTGLRKFLNGAAPYTLTLRRLRRWYLQYGIDPAAEVTFHEAQAALQTLTHDLRSDARREAGHCVLDCLARRFDAVGIARPEWIAQLRG